MAGKDLIYCKEMKKVLAGLLSFALLITRVLIADRSEAAKKIFDEKTNGLVDCPASEAEGYATINGTVLTLLGDAEEDNEVFIKK